MVDQAALQFQGEVAFGAADQDGLQEFAQGLVGDLLAPMRETGDLLLVLDHAQLFDGAADAGEAQPRGGVPQRAVPGDGEVVLLHGEGVDALGDGEAGGLPRRGRRPRRS
ncbi:hypothetical protein SALBM217S_09905 [Streptomyces griseoloalbus]